LLERLPLLWSGTLRDRRGHDLFWYEDADAFGLPG